MCVHGDDVLSSDAEFPLALSLLPSASFREEQRQREEHTYTNTYMYACISCQRSLSVLLCQLQATPAVLRRGTTWIYNPQTCLAHRRCWPLPPSPLPSSEEGARPRCSLHAPCLLSMGILQPPSPISSKFSFSCMCVGVGHAILVMFHPPHTHTNV